MSNSFDPDSVSPNLVPNCLQMLSTDKKVRASKDLERVKDLINLQIDGSRLQATYNLGDGPITVSLSQVPASDGQWHQVRLERYGKELMLKMDSGEGLYYTESLGPEIGKLDFYLKNDEIYSGVNLLYDDQGIPAINRANEQDFVNCKYL